jgi:hypothetical protein
MAKKKNVGSKQTLTDSQVKELAVEAKDSGADFIVVHNEKGQDNKEAMAEEREKHPNAILVEEEDVKRKSQPPGDKSANVPVEEKMAQKKNSNEPEIIGEPTRVEATVLQSVPTKIEEMKEEPTFQGLVPKMEATLEDSLLPVVFKDRPVCLWSVTYTKRNKYTIWEYNLKIDAFNNLKTFNEAYLKLIRKVLDTYKGVFHAVPDILEPNRKDKRIAGNLGFDLYGQFGVDKANPTDVKTLNSVIEALDVSSVGAVTKRFTVLVEPRELRLQTQLHELPFQFRSDIDNLHAWFKHTQEVNENTFLAPLDHALDRDFLFYSLRPTMQAYTAFVDNNDFMKTLAVQLAAGVIRDYVVAPLNNQAKIFSDLLNELNVRVGTFRSTNQIPSMISAQKGRQFLEALTTALLVGRWHQLDFEVDMHSFSVATLLDCFTIKLLVPYHLLSQRGVLQVDNYIAKYFLPMFSSFREMGIRMDPFTLNRNAENWLTRILDTPGTLPAEVKAKLMPFLYTTERGDGFANAGGSEVAPFPADSDRYLNRRDCHYAYYGGRAMAEDDDEVLQLTRFARAMTVITTGNLRGHHASFAQGLVSLLNHIGDGEARISSMFYHINRVARGLSLIAIMAPRHPGDDRSAQRPKVTVIAPMTPFSSLLVAKWEDLHLSDMPLKLIEYGWAINDEIEQLVFWWYTMKDYMAKTYYSKTERFAAAASMVEGRTQLIPLVKDTIIGTPNLVKLKVPAKDSISKWFALEFAYAREFIQSMANHMGFLEHFYYSNGGNEAPANNYVLRHYLFLGNKETVGLTRSAYETLLQNNQLYDYVKGVEEAGRAIRFEFPIMFEEREVQELKFPLEEPPVSTNINIPAVTTDTIYHNYQPKDEYYNPQASTLAFRHEPRWVPDDVPRTYQGMEYLQHFVGTIESLRKEFEIFDAAKLTFMSRLGT